MFLVLLFRTWWARPIAETQNGCIIDYGEINKILPLKVHFYWLAFTVVNGPMQANEGEK